MKNKIINSNIVKENPIKEDSYIRNNNDKSSILKSLESNYPINKKPFRANGLLNKSQLKLASFIKNHKDVTLQGTKRFMDKSGEYYLKNVKMQNKRHDFNYHRKSSLNNPQNLENCLNGNLLKIKRRASKIVTLLPENSLTPIPKKEGINKTGLANSYKKKELNDAQRTAVFIRRLEYANTMKKKRVKENNDKDEEDKIILIQQWWRTMYKIIKLQKNVRGFIFRKRLMDNLEHQEKLYQFITEFDNIYNYHIFRQFMDNMKKKRDYEKAKYMEKCEDFGEKLENFEKMNNMKNLRKCLNKWNTINKKQKKLALDNLVSKVNNLLTIKFNKTKVDTLKKIEDKAKQEEKLLDDKVKAFREKKAKENFVKNLIRIHKLKKILQKINDKKNKGYLKEALYKLKKYNDVSKAFEKLNKLLNGKIRHSTLNDLKLIYFVKKFNDIIKKHNNRIDYELAKDIFNELKEINKIKKSRNILNRWRNICNEINQRRKILDNLVKYKKDELDKTMEKQKNKLTISSNINDIQLISEQKPELINFVIDNSPARKLKKGEMDILKNQLNYVTIYNNNKKLKKYFDIWKEFAKRQEIKNELIKYQTKKISGDKLRNTFNQIDNTNNKNLLKEYFDKWKEISKKIRQNNLENFIQKLTEIIYKAKTESDKTLKKEAFEILQRNNNIVKAIEILQKFLDNKPKKDCFNALKKNAGMSEGFRILDKFFNKKKQLYKKDLYDKLKRNRDIQKASEISDKLISDKIKKEILNHLIKKYKQGKGFEILNNVINRKMKNDSFDRLILNNIIQKACEILEKLIKNKLIKDTWKKLIYMDFVDLLKRFKNKLEANNNEKNEKIKKAINNLRKLKKDEDDNILKKYWDNWKDISTRRKIKNYLVENSLKKKALNHWKNIKEKIEIFDELKKYLEKKKYEMERRNIFRNVRRKKLLGNTIKTAEKSKLNKLRKYFEIWKKNINNIQEKENILKNMLNIYKQSENNILKKYLNKWISNTKEQEEEQENEFPKYRKKPKFKEKEIIIEEDNDEFSPEYYKSKKNIFKDKYIHFKKYPKKENEYMELSQEFNYIETPEQEAPKIKKNLMKLKKYNLEDNESSSNEDTIHGLGETLIQKQKIIGEPRNYTSQSFFIDKNLESNSKNYDINSYNKNILPMKMKGDFISLIEQNPKILEQKNPRIQVTNATCDLDQIINNEENTDNELNQEEINNEIEKLNDNFIVDKNKVLSKVIKNCDKDLYAAQKPFRVRKEKWYSIGIPLNNNEAKWEFLNNIKGERGKNDVNKFELIQKEPEPIKEDITYNKKSTKTRYNVQSTKNRDNSFKLREINFMQYYRSPAKSPNKGENDREIIRYDRFRKPQKRQNVHSLFVNSSSKKKKEKNKYNIDRSHGKIELDPKNKTIDYDNYNDDSDDNDY